MTTKMIQDLSTQKEREERGQIKDEKFRQMLRDIAYKDEGVLFLKSLNNACLVKLQSGNYYQVS